MNTIFFPLLGYVPIVGWMIPLYLDTKNDLSQFHGRQGFVINFTFLILLAVWWVLQNFVPTSHKYLENYLLYGVIGFYGVLLIWGALTLFSKKIYIPYIEEKANRLKL